VQGLEGQQRDAISEIENLWWFRNKNAGGAYVTTVLVGM